MVNNPNACPATVPGGVSKWPVTPCGNCPFTRGGLKVRLGRAREILESLKNDGHFHCHKHLDLPRHRRLGCAGSNILALREGGLTLVPRLAVMTGHLDVNALKAESDSPTCEVFASSAEMVAVHGADAKGDDAHST